MEHNAVMRPLVQLEKHGISFDRIPCASDGSLLLDKAASHLEFGNPKQGRLTLVVQGITPDGKLINLTRTLGNE